MLKKGYVSSEQGIITYMIKTNPDLFECILSKEGYVDCINQVATGRVNEL